MICTPARAGVEECRKAVRLINPANAGRGPAFAGVQ
jgi:hypothetical protein